jgi:hypothetical protein
VAKARCDALTSDRRSYRRDAPAARHARTCANYSLLGLEQGLTAVA